VSWLFGPNGAKRDPAGGFERCVAAGGVAVFPADTVYGLACDPLNRIAVERLYLLKRRARQKAAAVMFFSLEAALEALPELPPRTREALSRLLPGGVTVLLPNPAGRFPLACGDDLATLGVRVPALQRFASVRRPVLQSSANRAGGPDPRRIEEVPELLRAAADLVIDAGDLPGTPSTVLDLRAFEAAGTWSIVREGLVAETEVRAVLEGTLEPGVRYRAEGPEGQFHFDPATYEDMIRSDIPLFDRLQEELGDASGSGARRILELGTGTGETTRRLLARHPEATIVGIDESPAMLERARQALPAGRVELHLARLEDPLPSGPFDLVASALCVHHLDDGNKADLFRRIAAALVPGGRFALADVVVPPDPADAVTSITPGFDRPSTVADQLNWLRAAGLEPRVTWEQRDWAVIAADKPATAGIVD
jgi:tRNA threonylcarbamoyl adenosine modification protein (Sua5/YciO/YrdC/YwlC family)